MDAPRKDRYALGVVFGLYVCALVFMGIHMQSSKRAFEKWKPTCVAVRDRFVPANTTITQVDSRLCSRCFFDTQTRSYHATMPKQLETCKRIRRQTMLASTLFVMGLLLLLPLTFGFCLLVL